LPQPDPQAPFWTMADIAVYADIAKSTVHGYNWHANRRRVHAAAMKATGQPHERCRMCPRPGDLPAADQKWSSLAGRPAWPPPVIIHWKEVDRPGSGAGGGRPKNPGRRPRAPRRVKAA
jgi:hypothetical protein